MDIDRHIAKADEALQRKNPDYAIGICKQILGLDPSNARARSCLISASQMKTRGKKSPAVVRVLLNFPSLVQLRLLRGLKKSVGVLKTCDRILIKDPSNARVTILAGETALQLGYDDAAIQIFESLGQGGGGNTQALKALGSLYRQKGQIQKALDCYEEVLTVDPGDHDAQRARKNLAAEEALTQKGFETAKSSRDLMKNKDQAAELERSSRIVKTPAQIQEAIDALIASEGAVPSDPQIAEELADLYRKNEDYSKAIELLERVNELKPNDPELAKKIGDLTIREMDQEIRRLGAPGPDLEATTQEKLSRLKKARNDFSVQEFGRRVRHYPTDLGLRHRYGKALLANAKIDEAIAEFQKAVNDPKSRLEALAALGSCFGKKKMYDLAAKQYGLAISASSEADRKTHELRYRLGRIFEAQNDPEKALAEYSKIYERDINFRDIADKIETLKPSS